MGTSKLGRGLGSMGQGLGSLQAYKKDQVSWDDVIKEARLFNYSPKDVSKLINEKFLSEFYGNTSFITFACCSVYHKALSKEKSKYAAQQYVCRHYPDLVDDDTRSLVKQYKAAKQGSDKRNQLEKKLRSKRNAVDLRYKRITGQLKGYTKHPSWNRYIEKYSNAAPIQKILKRYFVR
jgi:hypothetical protein|tara:strand:- start:227 stop:760 length:534 start_codon:yes stop_codon:yes gene_type:complete